MPLKTEQDYYLHQQRQEPAALGGGPSRGRGCGPEGACCLPGVHAPRARTRLTHHVPHPPAQPLGSDVDRKLGLRVFRLGRGLRSISLLPPLPPQDPCDSEKQPDRRPGVRRRPVSTSRLGGNCPPSRGRGSLRVTAPQKLPAFGEAGSEDTAGLPQTWEAIEASPSMIPVPHGPGAVPSGEQRPRAAASGAGGLRGRRLRVQRAQITWGLIAEDCPCNSTPGH